MGKREELLDYVDRRRTDRFLFAPLVDNFYSMCLAKKKWYSEVTLADHIEAARVCGYHPLFVGYTPYPAFQTTTRLVEQDENRRRFEHTISTPRGRLVNHTEDRAFDSVVWLDATVSDVGQLDIVDWISEQVIAGARDESIRAAFTAAVAQARPHGVVEYQLELPFFLYGMIGFSHVPIMMYLDYPDRYQASMALAEQALYRMADILIACGVDFIWIGSPGTEISSPTIMEKVIVPQARKMVEHVHGRGGRVHFHCCGRSKLWIEKGYFNQIGMDLLETLAPPPTGTVDDLAAARRMIDRKIVTKGNIDLERILKGSVDEMRLAARKVMEATAGYSHLVGAADAILYGTPVENLRAIQEECERRGSS